MLTGIWKSVLNMRTWPLSTQRSRAENPLKIKDVRTNCIDVEIECKTVLSIKPFY
jgi:hypothetical protein